MFLFSIIFLKWDLQCLPSSYPYRIYLGVLERLAHMYSQNNLSTRLAMTHLLYSLFLLFLPIFHSHPFPPPSKEPEDSLGKAWPQKASVLSKGVLSEVSKAAPRWSCRAFLGSPWVMQRPCLSLITPSHLGYEAALLEPRPMLFVNNKFPLPILISVFIAAPVELKRTYRQETHSGHPLHFSVSPMYYLSITYSSLLPPIHSSNRYLFMRCCM